MSTEHTHDEQAKTETEQSLNELIPPWEGPEPVNYRHIRSSFALAMQANPGIDNEQIEAVVETVDEAVANNEQHLTWSGE